MLGRVRTPTFTPMWMNMWTVGMDYGIDYPDDAEPSPALVVQIPTSELLRGAVAEISAWLRGHGFEPRAHRERNGRSQPPLLQLADIDTKIKELESELEHFRHASAVC
jgi:hypothetical protein